MSREEAVTSSEGKFLVVNCEVSQAWNPITFHEMFMEAFGREGDNWTCCCIAKGAPLPANISETYDGVVITGSQFNCRNRDAHPWFDQLCQLIKEAAEKGRPRIYGGCFGCQIIAVALGGHVDYNPDRRFILKAEKILPNKNFFDYLPDPLGANKRDDYYNIIVSHGDCVHDLPTESVLLASSPSCAHEVFVTGPHKNILASQSHPEFDLQYAILDRIWPRVVEQFKRLSDDEVRDSQQSFESFRRDDPVAFSNLVSDFLRQKD